MEKTQPLIAASLFDLPRVSVTTLEPFQGNLKELSIRNYAKLKRSLLEHGIIVPFFVWKETNKILDGHQRQRVFETEGWNMGVPVVYISAENEQEAKRKLLVIAAQYGKVTQDGWDEFVWNLPDAVEITHFDALPFVFFDWDSEGNETDLDRFFEEVPTSGDHSEKLVSITLHYSPDKAQRLVAMLDTMGGTREDIIWNLLGLDDAT